MSEQELEKILRDTRNDLFGFIYRRSADREAALDVLQNVYLKIAQLAHEGVLDEKRLLGLLFFLARRELANHRRKLHRTGEDALGEEPADPQDFADDSARILRVFFRALEDRGMNERIRESLRMYFIDEMKKSRIIQVLEVSRQTLDRDLARGIDILRRYFEEEGLHPDGF